MPRLLPLAALLPLLAALALAQPPVPKDPPPKKLTAEEKKELTAKLAAAFEAGEKSSEVGKMDDAVKAYEDVVKLARRLYNTADFPDGHHNLAASLNNLGFRYKTAGRLADAEPLYAEALVVFRRMYKNQDHPNVAASLNNLGSLYHDLGKSADAEARYADALAMLRRLYKGQDHPNVAGSMSNLGLLYRDAGKLAEAEPLLADALSMKTRLYKGDHPDVARAMNNLGLLSQAAGKLSEARRSYTDALTMWKRVHKDRDHPDVAVGLNNLGVLLRDAGLLADSEPLLKDALAMSRRLHKDRDHPDVASNLHNLGVTLWGLGRLADAESLLRDSLAMQQRLYKGDHAEVAISLNNLGAVLSDLDRPAEAEQLYRDALAMRKRLFKGDHPDVANSLNSLGGLFRQSGKPAAAKSWHEDALAMQQRLYEGDHPSVANSLNDLGALAYAEGKPAAEPLLRDALARQKRWLGAVAVSQSERDQIGSRSSLRFFLDSWLTAGSGSRAAERYAEGLAWKGSAFARQAHLRAAAQAIDDPALAKLFAERGDVARRFANMAATVPPADRLTEHGQALKRLAERKDEIDRELARTSEPFRKAKETATLSPDRLAKALPADAALVDYLVYTHFTPDTDKKGRWKIERRFLAFVVRNNKPVVEVELKAAKPIEEAVAAWRQAIDRGAGNGEPAATLRKLVWEPVAKHLEGAKTVLVSPDGALGRLPFAALPGSDPKKFLLEEVAIAVVPVPQLIPEMLAAKPDAGAKPSLLVVGGVDFDADAGTPTTGTEARAAVRTGSAGKWGALAGTTDEAKAVANAFAKQFPDGKATSLTSTGATEAGVRDAISGRRLLHFATHGFFAPPPPEPKAPVGRRAELFDRNRAVGVHPGLQCGLVLAGANKPPKAGADDGILTALEVAGLDLRGVDLAVLSACETGLGKDAGGEGVLGLQRAFQAAGARRVVSSLWKVPDQATAALMGRFYQHLWTDQQPPAEALRQAQLDLLRNPDKVGGWAKAFRGATADDGGAVEATDGRLPPRAWAAFTLSGDWR